MSGSTILLRLGAFDASITSSETERGRRYALHTKLDLQGTDLPPFEHPGRKPMLPRFGGVPRAFREALGIAPGRAAGGKRRARHAQDEQDSGPRLHSRKP